MTEHDDPVIQAAHKHERFRGKYPIEVQGLVNRFGDQTVHDGLDLKVRRGEILGVVGGSGTGKSVLMRSIIGLQQPAEGHVTVFGRSLTDGDPEEVLGVRNRWGVLFQGGALFSTLTVGENVEVPLKQFYPELGPDLMDEIARYKVLLSGLPEDAINKYPAELSGGMKKRAGLARALALDPELVFLDEPSADARTEGNAGPDRVPDHPRSRYALRDLRPGGGAGRQTGDRGRHHSRTARNRSSVDRRIFQRPPWPRSQGEPGSRQSVGQRTASRGIGASEWKHAQIMSGSGS